MIFLYRKNNTSLSRFVRREGDMAKCAIATPLT